MNKAAIAAAFGALVLATGSVLADEREIVNQVGAYQKGGIGVILRTVSQEQPAANQERPTYSLTGQKTYADQTGGRPQLKVNHLHQY